MSVPPDRVRKPTNAKPQVRGTSRTSKPRKSAAKAQSPPKAGPTGKSASGLIDQRIRELSGWRGETLARMRAWIREADPEITEEWKWSNPVWSHAGVVCTGEAYTKVVKLTVARGARIPDPARLFNSRLEGNTRRAIDIREGETVDAGAFAALVRAAVAQNGPPTQQVEAVEILSGGNPRIAKADGDAPVQAYIAAMPGWKRDVGRRLDALIARTVPNVCKAVKWNSPLYGIAGQGWFLSFHTFTRYVKVTFFRGTSLRPVPPGASKHAEVRYLDIHAGGELDEAQMATWVEQAAALPGWVSGRPS